MKKSCGFTLIELLIATSIFSIIILSIYSAFQTGILSYRKVDSAFETYQTARIALNRMELDLKNSFVYKTDDSRFHGTNTSVDFFSVVDYYKEDKLNTDICRIKYEWAEDEKILKRTCYTGLDALKETPEAPIETELSSAVKEFSFHYFYKDQNGTITPSDSWPDSIADQTVQDSQKQKLPLAVKIKLSLIEKNKSEENATEFNKTVSLPLGEMAVVSIPTSSGGTGSEPNENE